MTLREAERWGTREIESVREVQAGAAMDVGLLLRHAMGLTRAQILAWPDREMTPAQEDLFRRAIARRRLCEPVQYITGEQEFYGLALHVTPAVLIPRPETEVLVESVLGELRRDSTSGRGIRLVDVGTGSGAIALALARALPAGEVTAVDLSCEALATARDNAARHGLGERVRFLESDLLGGIGPAERFDAIVSNPPYVPSGDRAAMHPQVREHEPALALFAGESGLNIYRRLIPEARARLVPGGLLGLEIGYGQRCSLEELLAGWDAVRFVEDLQGIPRVVLARRRVG